MGSVSTALSSQPALQLLSQGSKSGGRTRTQIKCHILANSSGKQRGSCANPEAGRQAA